MVSRNGEEAHGSGRSIRGFHLLNSLESCGELFTRFGGHAHAVGFSLPSDRLEALQSRLDLYARAHLTLADFEPILDFDADLPFDQISPGFFQALQQLEPFGVGNPEPVFTARNVRLATSPRIIKEKHIKLRLSWDAEQSEVEEKDLAAVAGAMTPRCHPDSAAIRNSEGRDRGLIPATRNRTIAYNALGWRMAERIAAAQLLPGDALDIAFTLDHNDHPDFGGIELTLKDFQKPRSS